MTVGNIIKAAASKKGIAHKMLAEKMGITPQALSNKYVRDSFTAGDLIRAAETIGSQLAFVDGGKIVEAFELEDAAPKRRSKTE